MNRVLLSLLILGGIASANLLSLQPLPQSSQAIIIIGICLIFGFLLGKAYSFFQQRKTRPRFNSRDLHVEQYCSNGVFERTFTQVGTKSPGVLIAQHQIENKQYAVEMITLPKIAGKQDLACFINDKKGQDYVTSWIEEVDGEAILFLQRVL